MSDQKLRELERKWKETGSVEDEAAYLRERVRVGDLTQERLDLAAYCGHEGAARVVEDCGTRTPRWETEDWSMWALVDRTKVFGGEPMLLAATAACNYLLEACSEPYPEALEFIRKLGSYKPGTPLSSLHGCWERFYSRRKAEQLTLDPQAARAHVGVLLLGLGLLGPPPNLYQNWEANRAESAWRSCYKQTFAASPYAAGKAVSHALVSFAIRGRS